jgi:hypothetical protein
LITIIISWKVNLWRMVKRSGIFYSLFFPIKDYLIPMLVMCCI